MSRGNPRETFCYFLHETNPQNGLVRPSDWPGTGIIKVTASTDSSSSLRVGALRTGLECTLMILPLTCPASEFQVT